MSKCDVCGSDLEKEVAALVRGGARVNGCYLMPCSRCGSETAITFIPTWKVETVFANERWR